MNAQSTALLWVSLSQSSCLCHLRTCSHMVRIGRHGGITWAAGAATATVTAIGRRRRCCHTVAMKQSVHCTPSYGTIARRHWPTPGSHPSDCLAWHRRRWCHFEAVYVQVIAHLTTDFHGKVHQIRSAEYLCKYAISYINAPYHCWILSDFKQMFSLTHYSVCEKFATTWC